jgi:hypothetical protein
MYLTWRAPKDKVFNTNPSTTENMNEAAQQEMFALTTKYLQGAIWNEVNIVQYGMKST